MNYQTRKGDVSAVDDVSFNLAMGQSLGLVGESGCGKTSIAFSLLRLLPENGHLIGGKVLLNGDNILAMDELEIQKIRWRGISMVFQSAMNALDPVYRVGDQIVEALRTHFSGLDEGEAYQQVKELFLLVGLDPDLIADEPTTALDVIVQDRILNRLKDLQQKLDMGMIYISHDIAVIAEVSDQIGVMYAGRMAELASAINVFEKPMHPYTAALMRAFPSIEGEKQDLKGLPGEPPDLLDPPGGCRFHPRCPNARNKCGKQQPPFEEVGTKHYVACWYPLEVDDD